MEVRRRFITFTLSLVCGLASAVHAQSVIDPPPFAKTVNLSVHGSG